MWIDDVTAYIAALVPARLAVWPALGGAGAALTGTLRENRRRARLNEHLHEVRRPLQVLALTNPPGGGSGDRGVGPVEMAAAALLRLDREINGEGAETPPIGGPWVGVAVLPLLESARRRWAMQATLTGATIAVRLTAEEAVVEGSRVDLAAALDNLIANALEHGGGQIELAADLACGRLCLAVVDSVPGAGRRAREREARQRRKARVPFRGLSGRARRGHGLRVVRRTAARHGGAFALHLGEWGTSAVLELPLMPRENPERRIATRLPARPGPILPPKEGL